MKGRGLERGTRFQGLPISCGVAVAKVCLFRQDRHNELPIYKVKDRGVLEEKERFHKAVVIVADQLQQLSDDVKIKVGAAEAEIFAAQKIILQDPSLRDRVFREIEGRLLNGGTAVINALNYFESRIVQIDNIPP